jgi:antitoxin component YwqK of YwqJK toxin-antitoxin module
MQRDTDGDKQPDVFAAYDGQGNRKSLRMDKNGDGKIDTWQDYKQGELVELKRDKDGNGRIDTRVSFEKGEKKRLVRDADGDGYFETSQFYDRKDWDMVLERNYKNGDPAARLFYKKGALRKKMTFSSAGETDFVEHFDSRGELVKTREREEGGGELTWFYGEDGQAMRAERDRDRDGSPEETFFYQNGSLTRVEEDSNGDGQADIREYYDQSEALIRRETDLDHDGKADMVKKGRE